MRSRSLSMRRASASTLTPARVRIDGGQPALLVQQRGQQVRHVDLLMAVADRKALRRPHRFLQFLGEAIEVHTYRLAGR